MKKKLEGCRQHYTGATFQVLVSKCKGWNNTLVQRRRNPQVRQAKYKKEDLTNI